MQPKIPRLYYNVQHSLVLLPEWTYFLIELGYELADIPANEHNRHVAGLALPVRAFASSFVSLGVVSNRSQAVSKVNEAQVEYILNLPVGTSVYVRRDNNRKIKGVIESFADQDDSKCVIIRTSKNDVMRFPLDYYAARITVSKTEARILNKFPSGWKVEVPSNFVKCYFGKETAQDYILDTSFDVLIVGTKSVVETEVCNTQFTCKSSPGAIGVNGCLQEILRVREFLGTSKSYRVRCISRSDTDPENSIAEREPCVVVFDGAIAYLNHAHRWGHSHHIVLLDRTERQFIDAIDLINDAYTRRLDERPTFQIKIPTSIEMMIFKEQTT
jgi:hypothetical protein